MLLPYIASVRQAKRLENERAIVIKDGEYEQIQMYLTQPALLDQLEEAKVDVMSISVLQPSSFQLLILGDKNLCFGLCGFVPLRPGKDLCGCPHGDEVDARLHAGGQALAQPSRHPLGSIFSRSPPPVCLCGNFVTR